MSTDADDAGLVERLRLVTTLTSRLRSQDDIDEKLLAAADRIESQRREIEELRRRFENHTPVGYRYLYPHHDGKHYWEFSNGKEINAVRPVRSEPVYSSPHALAETELLARAEKAEAALANAREYKKAFRQATLENTRDIDEHHEAQIAEALKHIHALMEATPAEYTPVYNAASAFASKYGGLDGTSSK